MLKRLLKQFQTALEGSGLHPLPRRQASEGLPALIAQFESRSENRAGKRVRRAPRQRVCRTLKNLNRAAAAGARAGAVGKEAHKLLRAIRTFPDFETLEKRASKFIGFQNRVGYRRNERKKREREPVIPLDNSLALRRVDTVDHLTTVGRVLKLCVAQPGHGYYRCGLRDGSIVFWRIQRDGEVTGLLSIDADANEVEDCDGFDHQPLGLGRAVMLEILRKLNVTADNCEAFATVGALTMFLERPARRPDTIVEFQGNIYQVWGWRGQVAIRRRQRLWSHFRWCSRGSGWVDHYCNDDISLGQFVDLVAHCPQIATVVREQRASAATSLIEKRKTT